MTTRGRLFIYRLLFGLFAETGLQLQIQMGEDLDAPGPAHRLAQPGVAGASLVLDAEAAGDGDLAGGDALGLFVHHQIEVERPLVAAAEQGEGAM